MGFTFGFEREHRRRVRAAGRHKPAMADTKRRESIRRRARRGRRNLARVQRRPMAQKLPDA
jgi:hypothetical protein